MYYYCQRETATDAYSVSPSTFFSCSAVNFSPRFICCYTLSLIPLPYISTLALNQLDCSYPFLWRIFYEIWPYICDDSSAQIYPSQLQLIYRLIYDRSLDLASFEVFYGGEEGSVRFLRSKSDRFSSGNGSAFNSLIIKIKWWLINKSD